MSRALLLAGLTTILGFMMLVAATQLSPDQHRVMADSSQSSWDAVQAPTHQSGLGQGIRWAVIVLGTISLTGGLILGSVVLTLTLRGSS